MQRNMISILKRVYVIAAAVASMISLPEEWVSSVIPPVMW